MTKRQLNTLEELIETNPVAVARLLLQYTRDQARPEGSTHLVTVVADQAVRPRPLKDAA